MLSKEEFEKLINNLRNKLDETTNALVSEELFEKVQSIMKKMENQLESERKAAKEKEAKKNK